MLRNYLKIALRSLSRNKAFSFINIIGLSIGLSACMLIFLYTRDELSYDRFQQKKDQLFRVTCRITEKNSDSKKFGLAGAVQGPAFKKEIPAVEDYVRVMNRKFVVKKGNETFDENVSWVDEHFFRVFSFPLLSGNPEKILTDPHSIVLTDEMAKKYFGSADAIGKTLELEINKKFEPFVVSGIARRPPENSSIRFDILLPFAYQEKIDPDDGWLFLSFSTYLVLRPDANPSLVSAQMQKVYETKARGQLTEAAKQGFDAVFTWGLQPFLRMHLDTEVESNGINNASKPIYSYILTGIAFFILLIACINFVNITVAQSLKRSREIGLRKVVGGMRSQLILQFLGESFALCLIAFLLAILLASLALPLFNELANKKLSLAYLLDLPLVASFIGLFLLTGFAAGFYPALVLSGFRPVDTLYNRGSQRGGKNYLSKGLVVLQFSLATFLIIATLFVYFQYDYLTHADMGYNDKDLLAVNVRGQGKNTELLDLFRTEFLKEPGVSEVAQKMDGDWGTVARVGEKELRMDYEHIDENYLPTLQVPILQGRNFSKDFPGDSTTSVLVNEAFAKEVGWKDPIGKMVTFLNGQDCKLTVVGLVKDYHYASLKDKIGPQLFSASPHMPLGRFLIRIQPGNEARTLNAVEKTYRALFPWHPFDHYFIRENNLKNYEAENRWRQIISFAAILTIFISCIGLFGLTMLSIRKRTKEIGLRKVLGATVWQISGLVLTDFIGLVALALLPAIPAAWYATDRWLDNFAYRIPVNWMVFAAAGLLTLLIAVLTVSVQSVRAARTNPVNSLRTE